MNTKAKKRTLSEIIKEWNEVKRLYADDKKFLKLWNSIEVSVEKGAAA